MISSPSFVARSSMWQPDEKLSSKTNEGMVAATLLEGVWRGCLETNMSATTSGEAPYAVESASPGWLAFCGFKPSEILGKTLSVVQGPGTEKEALCKLMQAVSKREPFSTELTNYTKSGIPFINHITITPQADGTFKVVTRGATVLPRDPVPDARCGEGATLQQEVEKERASDTASTSSRWP